MSAVAQPLVTAVVPFSNGVSTIAPFNEEEQVIFSGTWAPGDNWTIELTDTLSGLQTQIGFGFASGVQPSFVFTFNQKVYVLAGPDVFCSAVDQPTIWNDPNALGNGFLELDNTYSTPEPLVAMAPFQGYVAFWSRWTIQIWSINADLAQWQLIQSMPNMGTLSGRSVQPLGTGLDDLFLSDNGYRSLRVREVTLAGTIVDIGSPVDAFVRKYLLAGQGSSACSVVDPLTGNYIGFLNPGGAGAAQAQQAMFCLSYYPGNKVIAWSTWDATDQAGNYFIPQGFIIDNGQIWAYGLDNNGVPALYQYGGANNDTYDSTVLDVVLPFADAKTPGIRKSSIGFDVVLNAEYPSLLDVNNLLYATWSLYATMDPQNVDVNNFPLGWTQQPIYQGTKPTYDIDKMKYSDRGTHLAARFTTSGNGPASLSSMTWHYNLADEK